MEAVKEIVKVIRRLFIIRNNAYGTRALNGDAVWQVKSSLTDAILLAHLRGTTPVGTYSLSLDGDTKWVCIDIDEGSFADAWELRMQCQHYSFPVLIEKSKSRGFHVWAFFQYPVPAFKARAVFRNILADVDMESVELFPKQNYLKPRGFGNFVWLPLFGYLSRDGLARRGRTVFVGNDNVPYPDQFEFLDNVEFISEEDLDEIIEINELELSETAIRGEGSTKRRSPKADGHNKGDRENDFLLAPPCLRRILTEGVHEGLRNESCFRLSILLSRIGIPEDLGLVMVREWNLKNSPELLEDELEAAVRQGYSGRYKTYGCNNLEAYCESSCPIYRYRQDKGWQ